jgi:tetratricopeptide (TPR) repeat protein
MKRWKAIVFASLLLMVGMCAWAQDTEMFEKAQAGDSAAQYKLGQYYLSQRDVPNSLVWLQKSAVGGNVQAQADLGVIYWGKFWVPQDTQKALDWTTKAALAGDPASQLNLSIWYWTGDIPQDREKSLYWLRRSAESGYSDAELWLGYAYRDGQYGRIPNPSNWLARYQLVPKDHEQEKYWFRKAAAHGNDVAKQELASLEKVLPAPAPAQGQSADQGSAGVARTTAEKPANLYDEELNSAVALLQSHKMTEAMQAAVKLIASDPDRWEGYGLEGAIERAQNKLSEAKAAYQRALSLAPYDSKSELARAIQEIDKQTAQRR